MFPNITTAAALMACKILAAIVLFLLLIIGWQHYITIPRLQAKAAAADIHETNASTCIKANDNLAKAVDKNNDLLTTMNNQWIANSRSNAQALGAMSGVLGTVQERLNSFSPDPTKSDCENAKAELAKFKAEQRKGVSR